MKRWSTDPCPQGRSTAGDHRPSCLSGESYEAAPRSMTSSPARHGREALHALFEIGAGFDLGGVDVQLPAPAQARLLTEIDGLLKETLEDVDAESLPNPREAGVIRQLFVERVAQIPAVGQVEAGR